MEKKRVRWLDVMKCLGIFAIYLGHLGPSVGYSYDFVFSHHVALFFFASGCAEAAGTGARGLKTSLLKRVRGILLPYFAFGAVSIFVYELNTNAGPRLVWEEVLHLLEGSVRNTFCAGGLWFLPCLFVVQALFLFLRRLCPGWLLLAVSLGMFCFAQGVLDPPPSTAPRYPYNIDSACYFFCYYVLGYLLFPWLCRLLPRLRRFRLPAALSTALCLLYAALLFFQDRALLSVFSLPAVSVLAFLAQPLPLIWLYILASWCLRDKKLLNQVGRDTLYLCGSEYLVSTGVAAAAGILGLGVRITIPLAAYLYSALLVFLADRFLVPLERRAVRGIDRVVFKRTGKRNEKKGEPDPYGQ